ncbi:MAG: hypothetical protein JSS49_05385 [Planctomycetes bacterium]|nr:hypothetical protein [Planctomycetota bacterium]
MIIRDSRGNKRRCGTIPRRPRAIPVGSAAEEVIGEYSEAAVRQILSDPNRIPVIEQLRRGGFLDTFTSQANQGAHGSCNGWLCANAYTLARWLGGNRDGTVFSGAYNYGLMNGGQDEGSVLEDGYHTSFENGFVPVSHCSRDWIYRDRTAALDPIAALNKADAPFPIRTPNGMITAAAKGCLIGTAIQVGRGTESTDRNGMALVSNGPGNHAVVCVDVRIERGIFVYDLYLDWGPEHGDGGFIHCTWDMFDQTFPNHMFWAMPIGQWGSA